MARFAITFEKEEGATSAVCNICYSAAVDFGSSFSFLILRASLPADRNNIMPIAAAAVDICQPTAKKKRKEVDLAANNGSGPSKKRVKKRCSAEGCINQAVKGGVCRRHGAKVEAQRCFVDGCTNQIQRRGVCNRHGANGDRCKFEGCTAISDFSGFCGYHQESLPNKFFYNLQIQQQHQLQHQQQQILRMGLASTMSSLGYRHHPPQWNNSYYYDNSFLSSNWASHCNFEGCNIVAIHGGFCFAHSASSFAPHAHADSQRGYVQGGGNQNTPTVIIIDEEEAGEKKQASITSRKQKEGVAEQSKTPPSCDTGEYCPDEFEQDGRGHSCAVEDRQKDGSKGVASLKNDSEQDTSDMRPQRRIRREVNLKDDAEQDASDDAPTQGGDEGGTGDAMEDGDSWGGDGQNEYSCEGVDNVHSEEGKQSHVLPEEIRATANDDEKEHELLRLTSELEEANNMVNETSEELEVVKSRSESEHKQNQLLRARLTGAEGEIKKKSDVIAELEEELEAEKAKKTEMDTQLMTTATSRLEERVAKDAANATVEEMTKKFEAESGAVAELKKEVAARLELNASLRNQLEKPSKGGIEVKEEELTDDEDFTARLKQKRTDQVLEELQTKDAKIQELQAENEQLKDDVRDKDQEITALKQQLIEMVQNRAEAETSEMI
eukprot:scaffold3622_cov145-Skeletonema_dohrnii-CCMP3373.AAC.9